MKTEIEGSIHVIRGQRVMVSTDLAKLYNVEPKVLTRAVKRNISRFPSDFMFQLSKDEFENLKSQSVTSSWGGIRRALPYAFNEHGVAMLSSVLNSDEAVQVNIAIIRTFVNVRRRSAQLEEVSKRIDELESKFDRRFRVVFRAIRQLVITDEAKRP